MKLATLTSKDPKNRHGELVVVSRDNSRAVRASGEGFPTLLFALENWTEAQPKLEELFQRLSDGSAGEAFNLDVKQCLAPLPNAPGFYDGSAFLSHVVRARRSRGDEMPESAKKTPLMYQGVSDRLLGWNTPIELMDPAFGGDFEGEFAVLTTDIPKGTKAEKLGGYMPLFAMLNDITFREIVKTEIVTKFGFLQSKPNSSFAPFAVTPDELGGAWDGNRIHADLEVKLNGQRFGNPNGKEMNFTFPALVAHACRTRPLSAGSIIGTGTVSNEDKAKGFACLTEKRFQEILDEGSAKTPWLKVGDHVEMDVVLDGKSVFGRIDQTTKI